MHTEHFTFKEPENKYQKIWRYMDFTKFVDLLNSSALYFTRATKFEDPFEGTMNKLTLQYRYSFKKRGNGRRDLMDRYWASQHEKERETIAVNCWHMNDYESAAMWKLYLKSNEGIAIQSTYNKLSSSFNATQAMIHVGTVSYVDYDTEIIPSGIAFSPFVHKRKSFEHERELRCLLKLNLEENVGVVNPDAGGVKIEADLKELIENIYVCPGSPVWLTELVKDVVGKFGFDFPVINSRLDDTPLR